MVPSKQTSQLAETLPTCVDRSLKSLTWSVNQRCIGDRPKASKQASASTEGWALSAGKGKQGRSYLTNIETRAATESHEPRRGFVLQHPCGNSPSGKVYSAEQHAAVLSACDRKGFHVELHRNFHAEEEFNKGSQPSKGRIILPKTPRPSSTRDLASDRVRIFLAGDGESPGSAYYA